MSGPNPDAFNRALQKFKQSISPDLARNFSSCTLADVRDACRDIQQQHGKERKLRNMRRLDAFVEAMEQFGKVIDMFVNASEFVCFVWGPVKFILNIARTYLDSFDKLLDVYAQVGEAIPGLLRYQATFEAHPPLVTVLEDYYSDILEFHQAALTVFRRPKWKDMFHSTWKTFDSKFKPIIQSLKRRRELLESEKDSATLYHVHQLRQDVSDLRTEQNQQSTRDILEKHKSRMSFIRKKLKAPEYQVDQETATENRHGHSSGDWIFANSSFEAWSKPDATGHGVVYVNGIPGAGKTILMSTVIERLLDERTSGARKHCVAYFYFKNEVSDKETHNGLLRAMLNQLIDQDPDISDRLFPDMSPTESMFLFARVVLENLLGQTKLSGLKQEIEPGIFPQGIEKAYERVAVRVFEKSSSSERDDATKVLSWIICARRPLRWREIQSFSCIDPVNGNVDYEERKLRVTCKDLCSSLVDVHHASVGSTGPEDVIKIVHETARG
ncbi:hypothetical protein GGR52DRAFT_586387 [Hypoxylon sp. FL1284]|nr:hypothetical protein GGR52DRAFT_586387 [Hypoxylon sp. FL1284]